MAPSTRVPGGLPREVDKLVLKCVRKDRADRPKDAGELLAAIAAHNRAKGWSNDHACAW